MVYVLMVGPHNSVKGGISTVVDSYLSWGKWENIRISYVPTYIEKNILIKIAFYFIHLLEIIGKCKEEVFIGKLLYYIFVDGEG